MSAVGIRRLQRWLGVVYCAQARMFLWAGSAHQAGLNEREPFQGECHGSAGEPDKLVWTEGKLRSEEAVGAGVQKSVELHVL